MNNDELKLKTDKKLPFSTILKRNIKYVKPELHNFVLAIVLLLINVGLGLLMPLFMGDITNELSGEGKYNFGFIRNLYPIDGIINFKFILTLVIIYFVIVALANFYFRF